MPVGHVRARTGRFMWTAGAALSFVSGCQGCHDGKPYTPYHLGDGGPTASASGSAALATTAAAEATDGGVPRRWRASRPRATARRGSSAMRPSARPSAGRSRRASRSTSITTASPTSSRGRRAPTACAASSCSPPLPRRRRRAPCSRRPVSSRRPGARRRSRCRSSARARPSSDFSPGLPGRLAAIARSATSRSRGGPTRATAAAPCSELGLELRRSRRPTRSTSS